MKLREKENDEDESTLFEYKLGLYCEMDTDYIGIKADLSRLFKQAFLPRMRKGDSQKADRMPVNPHRKESLQRALVKLRNFYLN